MKMVMAQVDQRSVVLLLALLAGSSIFAACGQQNAPVLQSASQKQEQQSEVLNARASASIRSSSGEEELGGAARKKLEVFTSRIEPLTVQKGGVAKILLPLSADPELKSRFRGLSFVSESSGLKDSTVQGRVLSLVVAEDAQEGRHEGKVVVRFENGSEFSQPLFITVLP